MKTINLINKYFRILEQDEQPSPDIDPNAQQDQQAPSAEPEPEPILAVTKGEKDLIILLKRAFTYIPSTPADEEFINKLKHEYTSRNIKELVAEIKNILDRADKLKTIPLDTPVDTNSLI